MRKVLYVIGFPVRLLILIPLLFIHLFLLNSTHAEMKEEINFLLFGRKA